MILGRLVLAFAVSSLAAGLVLIIVGSITDYYTTVAQNPLNCLVLNQTQIDEINMQYTIGRAEIIAGIPVFIVGLIASVLDIARQRRAEFKK